MALPFSVYICTTRKKLDGLGGTLVLCPRYGSELVDIYIFCMPWDGHGSALGR